MTNPAIADPALERDLAAWFVADGRERAPETLLAGVAELTANRRQRWYLRLVPGWRGMPTAQPAMAGLAVALAVVIASLSLALSQRETPVAANFSALGSRLGAVISLPATGQGIVGWSGGVFVATPDGIVSIDGWDRVSIHNAAVDIPATEGRTGIARGQFVGGWVFDPERDRVVRLDDQFRQVMGETSRDVGSARNWIVPCCQGEGLFVDPAGGGVARVSLETGEERGFIPTGAGAGDIIEGAGWVWVANRDAGTVSQITSGRVVSATIQSGARPTTLAFLPNGSLWIAHEEPYLSRSVDGTGVDNIPLGGRPDHLVALPGTRLGFVQYDAASSTALSVVVMSRDGSILESWGLETGIDVNPEHIGLVVGGTRNEPQLYLMLGDLQTVLRIDIP